MKCANCRKFIKKDFNDEYDPVKCGGECGLKVILCLECFNDFNGCGYIEECFDCKLRTQSLKLDKDFAGTGHGHYAANCDKSKWSYSPETKDDHELCVNLIVDTKLGLQSCLQKYIDQLNCEKLNNFYNLNPLAPPAQDIKAIFWLPLTTTGTFYESGLIPNMKEYIALSIYLENHFKKCLLCDEAGVSNKQKWLCDTFDWLEKRVRAKTHMSEFFKNVLSNCRILHYFVITQNLFPAVDTQNLLERVKCLLDMITEDANSADKDKFIAPIALYLANIEKEMAVAPRQANPNQPSNHNGKNDNNAPH